MFSFEDLNTSSKKTIRDGITLDGMAFVPLKDFIGKELKVDGFFFTNGKYGEQAEVIDGKLALTNIRELDSKNGKTVTFDYKTI